MSRTPDASLPPEEAVDIVISGWLEAAEQGSAPDPEAFIAANPEFAAELRQFFTDHVRMKGLAGQISASPNRPDESGPVLVSLPSTLLNIVDPMMDQPTLPPDCATAVVPTEPTVGATVRYFGDYELLQEIARGGMGVVYKARQTNLNRIVALKMILSGQLAGADDVKRFYVEAEAAAQLDHPGIVPIFEVGQHDGQHFFSMAFVEGMSLAKKVADGPLPPSAAVDLVAKMTEAIEYAHQKGIIHRDLKPANVLLDASGQPRVTDFGLAKQLHNDSDLTGTGQILGTPSYMPPEQAAGKIDQIGPASDVYSLGAILYCLLTGRPPFQAASAMDTLLQVMEKEPVPVRQLNSQVALDLDTITQKCLAKNPRERYSSAQSLHNDLRAFTENRAISARRATIPEKLVRLFRRQKRSVTIASTAGLMAMLAVISLIFGLRYYEYSQLGFVQFNVGTMANDRPVIAEVLNSSGELLQTISLPMHESAAISSGAYMVRLSAPGRLSESYAFEVTAGDRDNYDVSLSDLPLWKPLVLSSPDVCGFTNVEGETRIVVGPQDETLPIAACYSGRAAELSIHDRSAGGPALRWKSDWGADSPRLASLLTTDERRIAWKQFIAAWSQTGYEPQLIQSSLDIDQDGIIDLMWWYAGGVVAASGKDGTPLFFQRPVNSSGEYGQLAAPPVIFASDVTDKNKPDQEAVLVTLCVTSSSTWLEAVSTKIATPHVGNLDIRWRRTVERVNGSGPESFSDCSLSICRSGGQPVAGCVSGHWLTGFLLQSGEPAWPSFDLTIRSTLPAAFVDFNNDGRDEVLVVQPEETFGGYLVRVLTLESPPRELWRSTVTREESPLPFVPIRPPRIRTIEGFKTTLGSLRDAAETAAWPVVADLDNDKQLEIAVPARRRYGRQGSNGIVIFEGMSGKIRWERHWPLQSHQSGMGYFHPVQDAYAIGPDLNGDGDRELYIASIYGEQHREDLSKSGLKYHFHGEDYLYLDCLSGRDGKSLWWTREQLGHSAGSLGGAIGSIGWWGNDRVESMQLVIPVIRHNDTLVERTFVFSAATGRIVRVMRESARPVIGDFDSDGLPDLVTFQPDDPKAFEQFSARTDDRRGRLRVIPGTPPEPFRRLGQWVSAADFDGDGHSELIPADEPVRNRILSIVSGVSGEIALRWRVDWSHGTDASNDEIKLFPLPLGDFDHDGIADPIVSLPNQRLNLGSQTAQAGSHSVLFLQVLAGKTGRRIWREPSVPIPIVEFPDSEWGAETRMKPRVRALRATDLDGDKDSELLCEVSWDASRFTPDRAHVARSQRFLALIAARDGTLKWTQPYTDLVQQTPIAYLAWFDLGLPDDFVDLDADGILDVIFVAPELSADNLWFASAKALSGRDGHLLWQTRFKFEGTTSPRNLPIVVRDLDCDGRSEIVIQDIPDLFQNPTIAALQGDTGERLWSFGPANSAVVIPSVKLPRSKPAQPAAVPACVAVVSTATSETIVLDASGREIRRLPFCNLWEIDLGDESQTKLILKRNWGQLEGYRDGLDQALWKWKCPGERNILHVEPLRDNPRSVLVATTDSLFVLDALTGSARMRTKHDDVFKQNLTIDGPFVRSSFLGEVRSNGDDEEMPFVVDHPSIRGSNLATTVSRRMLPAQADGKYRPILPSLQSKQKDSHRAATIDADPRLIRPLPWVQGAMNDFRQFENRAWNMFFICFGLPLLVIVIPLRIIRRAIQDEQSPSSRVVRSFAAIALSTVALGIAGPIFASVLRSNTVPVPVLLLMAMSFLPVVVWPTTVIRFAAQFQWRLLLGLLLGTVAVSVVIGAAFIFDDQPRPTSESNSQFHYSWAGWWVVLILGAYAVGWILIALRLLGPSFKWMWNTGRIKTCANR